MGEADAFRLEFFNIFDRGARALLEEVPAFDGAGAARPAPPHLLVVGVGRLGRSLVVQAARRWRDLHGVTGERLRITLVDKEADHRKEALCSRYPQLEQVCELSARQIDVQSQEFERAQFLLDARERCDVTRVYVCLGNDSLAVSTALTLLRRIRGRPIPIVVRLTRDEGLAMLLRGEGAAAHAFDQLHAFGLLDRICNAELLRFGTYETLARTIHEDYVRQQERAGQTPRTNRSMVPWDQLPDGLQESNRRQAEHIGEKLRAVGCALAPLADWDADAFAFTPPEIELLAEMEHDRWVAERLGDGWVYAPGLKDVERRTSPDLVGWDDLSGDTREKDRDTVRRLPAVLAQAGFQLERLMPPRTNR